MTSRFTLLLSVTTLFGLGCSAPAEEGDDNDGMPAAPTNRPAFANNPTTPVAPPNTGAVNPTPTTETPVAPVVQTPVTPGAQGAAGSTGAPTVPGTITAGAGLALTPSAGFISGTGNEVGIQGYFYTFNDNADGGNTTIQPADFALATGSTICASGVGAQIAMDPATMMPAYGKYWGGGIGLNLADSGNNMPGPWTRGKVVGFSFNVTGTGVPPAGQFRFKATFYEGAAINSNYCVNAAAGANTIMLSQIVNACYMGGVGTPPLAATAQLQALQWQVATVATATTPFNFCIENLKAITAP